MIKKGMLAACTLALAMAANAQNAYDAERVLGNELNGTARFVGMGGAMSALGGDISVMGTNPAGIGIFRRNDASISFGLNSTGTESRFNGTSMKEDKTRASLDQLGFVYAHKIGNTTSLRYVNFGFNYHKSKNFNRLFSAGGQLDGLSQSWQLAQELDYAGVNSVSSFDDMTNLSKELREKLKQEFSMHNFEILKKQESADGTKKYLFDILDGNAIETVLMEYHHGKSICVSTQVGCKMGCKFCASTGIKFSRDLSAGEIVEQILAVERDENIKISNVVFMGIGEPLDNFENVVNAIKILNNQKGLNIGARHISISTSGLVPKIYELADKNLQCTLSISLHATNDKKRSEMMPINNAYNIEELIKACKYYIDKTNRRISFEYALAKDNNDNLDDAKELVKLLKGMLCHVNLIPINKIENGNYTKSTNENIIKFRDYLNSKGIVATIRRELGSDIDAACGQLRKKNLKE